MIGVFGAHASAFLILSAVVALLLGVPMLVSPIDWARALRWKPPRETDLTVYFGRCLGAVVTTLGLFALLAVRDPGAQPFFFELALTTIGINIGVHVYGAVKKIQPLTETVEIALWVLLFALGLVFFPCSPG
jgi:hypothetical protein